MRSILIALIAALCALPAIAAEQQQAPKDMVLLTVSGTIGESNRGALDPKKDSQLALQKADFKKAFAFDRAMLLGLEQGTVTATTAELGAPATTIATGGLAPAVIPHCRLVEHHEPSLTLEGLRLVFEKNVVTADE